jgi:hypothetical protein
MVRIRKPGLVEVGAAAEYPVQDVVTVAPLGWMITARETAAALPGDRCHGLAAAGDPSLPSHRQGDIVLVDDGGPNVGLIGNPQQLIAG